MEMPQGAIVDIQNVGTRGSVMLRLPVQIVTRAQTFRTPRFRTRHMPNVTSPSCTPNVPMCVIVIAMEDSRGDLEKHSPSSSRKLQWTLITRSIGPVGATAHGCRLSREINSSWSGAGDSYGTLTQWWYSATLGEQVASGRDWRPAEFVTIKSLPPY